MGAETPEPLTTFPPDRDAAEVAAWLAAHPPRQGR
jgi:hypothetical protein